MAVIRIKKSRNRITKNRHRSNKNIGFSNDYSENNDKIVNLSFEDTQEDSSKV